MGLQLLYSLDRMAGESKSCLIVCLSDSRETLGWELGSMRHGYKARLCQVGPPAT